MCVEIRLPPRDADPLVQASVLADPRQRYLLSLLLEGSRSLTERDLAIQLGAHETESAPSEMSQEDYQEIRDDLRHRYLPKLEAVGWIERHPEGIFATEHLAAVSVRVPLSDLFDFPLWEALTALLARPRRQHIVSVIVDHSRSLTLEELGAALAASEYPSSTADGRDEEPTILTTLHHVDLPKFDEVGLIEYNSETGTITGKYPLRTLLDRTAIGSTANGRADIDC